MTAIKRPALTKHFFQNRPAAFYAWFVLPTIDRVFLLKITSLTVAIDEIPQGTSSRLNSPLQYGFNSFNQRGTFLSAKRISRSMGNNTRLKETFIGVNIPHSDHNGVIHQYQFDRPFQHFHFPIQIIRIKFIRERFRAKFRQ